MTKEYVRVHGKVFGKVQCVGFRSFTEAIAKSLKLNGTVENKGTDCVEFFVEGEKDTVIIFLKCLKYGSKSARVDESELKTELVTGEIGFKVIYPVYQYPLYSPFYGIGMSHPCDGGCGEIINFGCGVTLNEFEICHSCAKELGVE